MYFSGVSAEQYRQMTKGALEMEWFCIDCSAEKTNLNSTSALEVPPQHTINVSPLRPLSMMRPSDMTYIVEPADDAEITEIITDDVSVSRFEMFLYLKKKIKIFVCKYIFYF